MRLLDLPEPVQDLIRDGRLSTAHGVALARFKGFPAVAERLAHLAVEQNWPSRSLEDGLPGVYKLQAEGLIRAVTGAPFKATCQACPFGAYREGDYTSWCLKPEHAAELYAEDARQESARRAEAERALVAQSAAQPARDDGAASVDGGASRYFPRLVDLGHRVSPDLASNCAVGACPCYREALRADGAVVGVCADPTGRLMRQRPADTRARHKAARAVVAERRAALDRDLGALGAFGPREAALLAAFVAGQVNRRTESEEAAARWLPALAERTDQPILRGYVPIDERVRAFAEGDVLDLLRFAVAAILGAELRDAADLGADRTAATSWYLAAGEDAE